MPGPPCSDSASRRVTLANAPAPSKIDPTVADGETPLGQASG
jgi:hypothetical protein